MRKELSYEEKRERREKTEGRGAIIVVVSVILLLLIGLGSAIAYHTDAKYEFKSEVGTHIEAAKRAKTPELVKEELLSAKQGMINLNLTPEMSCKIREWNRVYQYSMEYQYELLDSAIQRCDELIEWRTYNLDKNDSAEAVDIYSQKMENLKDDIEGITDIAHTTWIKFYHPYYAYWAITAIASLLIALGVGFAMVGDDGWIAAYFCWGFGTSTLVLLVLLL